MKSAFLSSYILLFIMISLSMKSYGQYTEKQLKRLDKMEIKAAIYSLEVNEPIISKIIIYDRSHLKTLIPGIVLSVVSAPLIIAGLNLAKSNTTDVVIGEGILIGLGTVAGIGSLHLHASTIIRRIKRNKLIKQLKKQ